MTRGTRRDVLRAALVTVAVPVVVVVAGMAVTTAAAGQAEGWTGLGYVILGMAGTAVLALVALLVAARVAFARALPAGQRLAPALAAIVGVAVPVALPWFLPVQPSPGSVLLLAPSVLLLALPVLLPLAVTGHLRWRWVAGLVGVAVVTIAVGAAVQERAAARSDLADVAAFGDALPLAGGRSFDSPLPGYRHLATTVPTTEFGDDLPLRIQWRNGRYPDPEANYVVTVSRRPTDCTPRGDTPTCVRLGEGEQGPIVRYHRAVTYVFVRVGDVEWQVEGLGDADAQQVLAGLEPVDAETFWRADQHSGELN